MRTPPFLHFSPRYKILTLIGVVGVLVFGTIYAVSGDDADKPKEAVVYELAPADVMTVQAKPLTRTLRLSGSLSPLRHAVVKAHSVGTVLELRVEEGDAVRQGKLLARIDPRNLIAELDARTAALRKAEADVLLAKKNRDNSAALLERKLISQNAYDQTVATHDIAVANAQAAQAQVRLAENALQDSDIRAGFDGVVAMRHVQAGERVMPDTPLVTLVDLRMMQLEALVPVADIPAIKVGQAARFKVDGFGAREFVGRVERINPQTQQGTRSLAVYLTVANRDGALKGGMFADGELVLEQTDARIAVPSEAIRNDGDGAYVLALQDGVVTRKTVATGTVYADSGMTVIETGLAPATRVIVAPATTLKVGEKAKVSG